PRRSRHACEASCRSPVHTDRSVTIRRPARTRARRSRAELLVPAEPAWGVRGGNPPPSARRSRAKHGTARRSRAELLVPAEPAWGVRGGNPPPALGEAAPG